MLRRNSSPPLELQNSVTKLEVSPECCLERSTSADAQEPHHSGKQNEEISDTGGYSSDYSDCSDHSNSSDSMFSTSGFDGDTEDESDSSDSSDEEQFSENKADPGDRWCWRTHKKGTVHWTMHTQRVSAIIDTLPIGGGEQILCRDWTAFEVLRSEKNAGLQRNLETAECHGLARVKAIAKGDAALYRRFVALQQIEAMSEEEDEKEEEKSHCVGGRLMNNGKKRFESILPVAYHFHVTMPRHRFKILSIQKIRRRAYQVAFDSELRKSEHEAGKTKKGISEFTGGLEKSLWFGCPSLAEARNIEKKGFTKAFANKGHLGPGLYFSEYSQNCCHRCVADAQGRKYLLFSKVNLYHIIKDQDLHVVCHEYHAVPQYLVEFQELQD